MSADHQITINGRRLSFAPGETILDVARRNHIFIPTLCHLRGAPPTGACRVCVVRVEDARTLMASCTVPAAPKMVVHTDAPEVLAARRTVLELLLGAGNHNCAVRAEEPDRWTTLQREAAAYDHGDALCPVYGACKLQALSYRYQAGTGELAGRAAAYPMEMASPLIVRDFSRCILCGRCVQACNTIQVNNALAHGFRGIKAKIVAMGNAELDRSDCVFCGECLQACPVAALVETRARYRIRPWEARHARTTCSYCSVGCQLRLHIKDGRIHKVSGVAGARPNDGRLCAKGRFGFDYLTSARRLTRPQVRRDGRMVATSWDEALDLVAGRIREVRQKHGARAIAGICSGRATNESLYSFQKLFRAVIGTPHVTAPFAAPPMAGSLAELESAACLLLVDADVTQENPVAGAYIKRAVLQGRSLIVLDSRDTRIADFATLRLQTAEGAEPVVLNGLIRLLLEGHARSSTMDPQRAAALRETAKEFDLEHVTSISGIARETIEQAAAALAEHPVMVVYGPRAASWRPLLSTLQEVLQRPGRERGGVNPLAELCNSVGAVLMGAHPSYLPGYRPYADAAAREQVAGAWNCKLDPGPGLSFTEILTHAAQGDGPDRIRLLFSSGEDLAVAQRAVDGAPRAVEAAEFLVALDILESETTRQAHVVLPAAAWGEEDGTYTSCERRVSRTRRAVDPPGEARSETWILGELARRLGAAWNADASPQAIWDQEIVPSVPQLRGITYASIEDDGAQWPAGADAEGGPGATAPGAGAPGDAPLRIPELKPQWHPLNYHHRVFMEECEGLTESLALAARSRHTPGGDPDAIRREFDALLEQEEAGDKKAEIDEILTAYRARRGGLIPVLQKVQEILGFLPIAAQNYIALGLGLSAADVFGVVSFYSFFTMTPRGRQTIRLCLGTACYVKGAARILEKIETHLKIKVGQTTPDREFGLEAVRCVGACGLAPVMVVGETTHGMVPLDAVAKIIEGHRSSPDETR